MKKIFLLVLFFSCSYLFSQELVKVVFLDSFKKVDYSENYQYKRIIKTIKDSDLFSIEDYWKTGELNSKVQVRDYENLIKEGVCELYHKNGVLSKKLNFKNDTLVGEFTSFYENGKIIVEGDYKKINNENKLLIKNYWDKNGIQKVINYNGVYEVINGYGKLFIGKIKDGLFEGEWKTTNNDYPKNIEIYNNGNLIKGELIKSKNSKRKYNKTEVNPEPPGGINEFRNVFAKKLQKKCSKLNYKISGTLRIKFVVLEDGNLSNFIIVNSINDEVDNLAIDVLKEMPVWESGISYGKEVKVYYTFPIKIDISL